MDTILNLINQLKGMGITGWLAIGIVGVILFMQYKNGNLANVFSKFSSNKLTEDDVRFILDDHLNETVNSNPAVTAYESLIYLRDYFKDDTVGLEAITKAGERLIHVKPPPTSSA